MCLNQWGAHVSHGWWLLAKAEVSCLKIIDYFKSQSLRAMEGASMKQPGE